MAFGQQARHNGNHNNLIMSMGTLTQKEKETIKTINVAQKGRPHLLLTYAKMMAPNYVTVDEASKINPNQFSGRNSTPYHKQKQLQILLKHNLVELHPDDNEKYRITPFGMKYLYAKRDISKNR
jgi:hypothetical protein